MQLETLLSSYGYLGLLIGTFLEGEAILVLGGLAAHQGYLKLPGVILAAFLGSLMGGQFFFYMGRRHNSYILNKWPAWKDRIAKVDGMLNRYGIFTILIFRFLYGLRTIIPFVLGMSTIRGIKFVPLNAIGALFWVLVIGAAGYFFGHTVEIFMGEIKQYESYLFFSILFIGSMIWLYSYKRHR